ncbi:MAG: glycoside hydrolase family 16 protein [Bryobacteraceae bacterium]
MSRLLPNVVATAVVATLMPLVAVMPGPAAPPPWRLIWSDEFDGPAQSPPDASKWSYDLGAGKWGNEELETYTDSRNNSFQDGQGHLVIRALQTGPGRYTSARLNTAGKFSVRYGRIEARIRIPYGQGLWPAFWMLGDDVKTTDWPGCGEIDIMENIGREPSIIHGTVHGPDYSGAKSLGQTDSLPSGRFADDYHVYAVNWSPKRIDFLLDGKVYFTVTPASLPAGSKWVYDHPFFIIMNVAVGGSWPGNPDVTTTFPQLMLVDYVRVYRFETPRVRPK